MKKQKSQQTDITEILDNNTGEVVEIDKALLGKAVIKTTVRPDGSLRIQQDFSYCPTMAEQHTGHLTDINYLMSRYQPDELAAYIAARSSYRQEILGHDFSKEPSLQAAKNVVYESRQIFQELPEDIQSQFKNHVDFLKFIDNPANAEKLVKMGILTKKQLEKAIIPEPHPLVPPTPTTTQEKE